MGPCTVMHDCKKGYGFGTGTQNFQSSRRHGRRRGGGTAGKRAELQRWQGAYGTKLQMEQSLEKDVMDVVQEGKNEAEKIRQAKG